MSTVLGLNGLPSWHSRHDPGAALVVDGRIAAAVEEERPSRVKRAMGLAPMGAVEEVLRIAAISPEDIDVIAYPWLPDAVDSEPHQVAALVRHMLSGHGFETRAEIRFVEHHAAHAWSAMAFVPPELTGLGPAPRIGALVLDASGETTSGAAFCSGSDGDLVKVWNLSQRSSLGAYYEAVTQYIGFGPGEEGKTMGLASYAGTPSNRLSLTPAALSLPTLPDERFEGRLPRRRESADLGPDSFARLRSDLLASFARNPATSFEQRAALAQAAETRLGERILDYVEELLADVDVLTFSGGVAMNCTINAKIAQLCQALRVPLVIPPPAGDTGVALGAAVAASRPDPLQPVAEPFLGAQWEPDALRRWLSAEGCRVQACSAEDLARHLAEDSAVCGWFHGRAEIGPRALGRRSVLARPDSTTVRDRINRLKGREGWRPLAPSMTAAEFAKSMPGSHPSSHMLIAGRVDPSAGPRLGGVTHVDGSARAQVVREPGPYLELIRAFGAITGTEAITCTSFNRAGEPIVHTPRDALNCARAMGLDFLAGEGWCVDLRTG